MISEPFGNRIKPISEFYGVLSGHTVFLWYLNPFTIGSNLSEFYGVFSGHTVSFFMVFEPFWNRIKFINEFYKVLSGSVSVFPPITNLSDLM